MKGAGYETKQRSIYNLLRIILAYFENEFDKKVSTYLVLALEVEHIPRAHIAQSIDLLLLRLDCIKGLSP